MGKSYGLWAWLVDEERRSRQRQARKDLLLLAVFFAGIVLTTFLILFSQAQ